MIRATCDEDLKAIEQVHLQAFPTDAEARLIGLIVQRRDAALSLVAEDAGRIVGHVLLSPVTIHWPHQPDHTPIRGLGLAPLAVVPEFQRQGIGSALTRAGLAGAQASGAGFVVLVGHPDYYPRFGFVPAGQFGLTCDFGDGPAFQILFFDEYGKAPGGVVRYADEFYELFAPPA